MSRLDNDPKEIKIPGVVFLTAPIESGFFIFAAFSKSKSFYSLVG